MEIAGYKVLYHPLVSSDDLPALPVNIQLRIRRAIEGRLRTEPIKFGIPLRRSLKGYRKLRVGDYRIVYAVTEKIVIILKIGHRKKVYESVVSRIN